ncbi:hypothetical protein DFH08DRAFT_803872 [Mycena albidolilacea]|uniref:Uncharacterized protein n=1 Tax=Mycena albidolilacea TaxID=1033008 RepID=A0AAD7AE04_9AGAR|nr:hypothetical protein DFH08DRAFT_803872 [Mycena albidolilacea]
MCIRMKALYSKSVSNPPASISTSEVGKGTLVSLNSPPARTVCDALAENTLATTQTDEESTLALYGTVPDAERRRVHVVVAGVCVKHAQPGVSAAFGVYWGDNSAHNRGFGIPGRQLDARAILHAILFALTVANPSRVVDISTTSKYAIRSICYLAGGNHTRGWSCANGDLLELIARAVQARTAQTVFTLMDSPRDSSAYREARAIATATCLDPERDVVEVIASIPPPSESRIYVGAPATVPRVWTALEKADPPAARAHTAVTVAQLAVADKPDAHRNRVVYCPASSGGEPQPTAYSAYHKFAENEKISQAVGPCLSGTPKPLFLRAVQ